ncbi:MAG: hypothetical protein HZB42_14365 [Sphingobacteriales bacterium]|nr:hypothetical protein [Sphingobacteriales bacterium]
MDKKPNLFLNALLTPGILFTLIRNVKRQQKFLQKELGPQLAGAMKNNDSSLDNDDIKKITHYYGLAVPCILGEALCVLRGSKMTLQERLALTYQGAMTGLFDDFFDKEMMTDDAVKNFMESPEQIKAASARQQLFLDFYKKALQYSHNPELTLHYLRKVYDAQIESKKQALPGALSPEQIKNITIDKGGMSVLFYRAVLANPISNEEETALYQMGGLMQFGNDIFDLYKDCLQHIDTLMTTAKKTDEVRAMFGQMMKSSYNSVYKTRYARKNIKKFLRLFSMSLCARCFVCLDQLEKKEMQTGTFTPYQYNRQDLVCDMDKSRNKWKSVHYFMNTSV